MKTWHKNLIIELNEILNNISKTLGSDRSTFYIYNEVSSNLESIVAQGLVNKKISVSIDTSIAGLVIKKKQFVIENDVQNSSFFNNSFDVKFNYQTCSTLCVPIFFEKSVF